MPLDPGKIVGWEDYVSCQEEEIALLDEAIFDLAYFIASLSAVDGAVVLTKRSELLGFGGFILGDIDEVQAVARALDTFAAAIVCTCPFAAVTCQSPDGMSCSMPCIGVCPLIMTATGLVAE